MTAGVDMGAHAWAVLAAVLAEDREGLHELMQPLTRDELDFLCTGLCGIVAGLLVGLVEQEGYDSAEARRIALEMVRGAALAYAAHEAGLGDGA